MKLRKVCMRGLRKALGGIVFFHCTCGDSRLGHVRAHRRIAARPQQVIPADDLGDRTVAQSSNDCSHLLGQEEHEVRNVFRGARELFPQLHFLRRHTNWASVHVANSSHDAAFRNHRNTSKAKLLATHHGGDDDVPTGLDATINAERHTIPEAVRHEDVLGLAKTLLPRCTCMHDAAQRRSASATVMAGDLNHISLRFRHARSDGADASA
mmetsp:Transcript_82331/g.265455  ORF Transcript_82331/g.265455 Transcript_82331/m.265455 type:complete len:210 (+) Transcript_82331:1081-1710(+)